MCQIALTAAVFAVLVSVGSELCAAAGAGEMVDRPPVDAVWMTVPPRHPAGIRAELFSLALRHDPDRLAALHTRLLYMSLAVCKGIALVVHF